MVSISKITFNLDSLDLGTLLAGEFCTELFLLPERLVGLPPPQFEKPVLPFKFSFESECWEWSVIPRREAILCSSVCTMPKEICILFFILTQSYFCKACSSVNGLVATRSYLIDSILLLSMDLRSFVCSICLATCLCKRCAIDWYWLLPISYEEQSRESFILLREKPPLKGLVKPLLVTFFDEGLNILGYFVDEK